jgi:hypothetical protein
MSYMRQMQILADEFYRETREVAATKTEMAQWAISTGRWNRHEEAALKQCAEDFAQAMRKDYETDPQGRRVRTKYAASIHEDGRLVTKWGDRKRVSPEFAEVSIKQRRNQIVGDVYQLKQDRDSYVENCNGGRQIPLPLDFTPDIEELEEMARRRRKPAS